MVCDPLYDLVHIMVSMVWSVVVVVVCIVWQ